MGFIGIIFVVVTFVLLEGIQIQHLSSDISIEKYAFLKKLIRILLIISLLGFVAMIIWM